MCSFPEVPTHLTASLKIRKREESRSENGTLSLCLMYSSFRSHVCLPSRQAHIVLLLFPREKRARHTRELLIVHQATRECNLVSFADDDCRVGKKRKTEENDQMLTVEESRKLTKTQGAEKVKLSNKALIRI